MKFELKTENDNFSKLIISCSLTVLIISFIIIIFNIAYKLGKISRNYEVNYRCRLLTVDKSSSNFKSLSKLINQNSKQKIWDFCKGIVK